MSTATANPAKRPTKATFKSFIRKNAGKLHIRVRGSFDGQTDGVESTGNREFTPVIVTQRHVENSLGIQGLWLTGGGDDYFIAFQENGWTGFEYHNCCGRGEVVIESGEHDPVFEENKHRDDAKARSEIAGMTLHVVKTDAGAFHVLSTIPATCRLVATYTNGVMQRLPAAE